MAEVACPIAMLSRQAARRKPFRHGHLSALCLLWAPRDDLGVDAVRRPLDIPEASAAHGGTSHP